MAKNEFINKWGVLIATLCVQVGMYMAGDGRLKEDVKELIADMKNMKDFKSAYTVKVDSILEKIRWLK